jgi:hypothetical protein
MNRRIALALAAIGTLVVVVGGPAAVASYGHARKVARMFGETTVIADWLPLTTDGLLFAALAVITIQSWRGERAGGKVWAAFWVGTAATLGANLAAADLGTVPAFSGMWWGRALVALWPPIAFAVTLELAITLVGFVRAAQTAPADEQTSDRTEQVAETTERDVLAATAPNPVRAYLLAPTPDRAESAAAYLANPVQSGESGESGTDDDESGTQTDEIPVPVVTVRQPRPRSASDVRWTEQDEAIRLDLQTRYDETGVRPTPAEVRSGYGMGYNRAVKIIARLVEPVPAEGSAE